MHGIDLAPTAIAAATRSAADRGLRSVTFQRADVTTIAGFDGRFNTVVDSALFWKAHRTTIGHGKPATTMYGRNTVQCNGSHITTGKY